ncbi:LacI family DNA-binding transcriptional regulator [Nocardia sp. NPDC058499]|uniref:LacI family DNA-binding transcriptional regulator n=1 Tax=Nocardia sp. NPDC058499 TaxID=3346530 RepID=UPI0036569EDD
MPVTNKRVTAADVARSLGLSRATVGFVLNNTPGQTIPESTRKRVLDEAERLGYRPNPAAQALRRGSTRLVMLLLPDWPIESSMAGFLDEVSYHLDQAGYTTIPYTRRTGDRVRPLWERLHPDVILGLGELDAAEARSAQDSGVRSVITLPVASSVAVVAGTVEQVRHLYSRGHRRLAFAQPVDERLVELGAARLDAAQATAAELGIEPLRVRPVSGNDGSARRAVEEWRDEGVTGVVAFNDFVAALVVGAAVRVGIGVPAPLAVIGQDDSLFTEAFVPALSTVRMEMGGLVRYVTEMALHAAGELVAPPEEVAPDLTVVRREST